MPAAMAPKSRARHAIITTVEEFDARKRTTAAANGHTHGHSPGHDHGHRHEHKHGHEHSVLPTTAVSDAKSQARNGPLQLLSRSRGMISSIMSDSESRSIFMFLLLNLSYMFVQIVYGYITNSLGLISDAIHMLFDCMALAIGLVAAVMSKWPASEGFAFGYDRIEVLSGFSNGVFLMLISVSIFFEAIERLMHPPEMNTQRLLLVSFGGLV
ncbi:hypothetical protein EC988_008348, partial [Linderina pennispora]